MINGVAAFMAITIVCAAMVGWVAIPVREPKLIRGAVMKQSEALKSFREEMGLTQTELAELLGVNIGLVIDLEDGERMFTEGFNKRFADRVGIGLECYRWCKSGDPQQMPEHLRESSQALTDNWDARIQEIIENAKASMFLGLKPGE